jgi:predicted transposase/invertase (TIGR01784 family)
VAVEDVRLQVVEEVVEKPVKDMNAVERWGTFFNYVSDKSKRGMINEIIECDEGIAMASQVLMTISRDEVERARLISEEKYILDIQSKVVHARRPGEAKGTLEIARKMKQAGRPFTEIAEFTGLTPEEIQQMKNEK